MKILCAALFTAVSLSAAELTVELQNPPDSGQIEILLFDSAASFKDLRDPAFSKIVPATGQTNITISDVPAGDYALMVHHDENSNGKLDKNFIGIPREPVGFANGYSPKGPPGYNRARLTLNETNNPPVSIQLSRPLGERGRLGLGVGAIIRTSPYRGADSIDVLPIPALTYTGERLQVFGPQARYMLTDGETVRVALAASYRAPAYDEDDSPALAGLGNRKATLMAGPEVRAEILETVTASLSYNHDVLDRIGGGEALAKIGKRFEFGDWRITPSAGLRWTSSELVRHDYGTPAYRPSAMITPEIGISALLELTDSWWISVNMSIERLDSEAADSPIVDTKTRTSGFLAVSYLF
jgi:MipA family protein